ncbi:MAG: hypothetical protein EBS05_25655, partial [Proteobacteria bacterium]|nr:hypothetical protein [Pseudomonadota bacterium]
MKEADALAQAGYQVRVVAVSQNAEKDQLDRALTARRPWRLEVVKAHRRGPGRARWLLAVLRQQICLRASRFVAAAGLQGRAYSRFGPELARLAAHQRADLYIGHTLPALPAVVWAARRHGARLGFDAEDFQSGIRALHASPTHEDRLSEAIEAEYLPQCDHLTSASPGVSQALAELCGGRVPVPVLNVFSLADRPSRRPQRPAGGPLRLYWFSHVVGTDRGLEDAVLALRQLPAGSAELHLRGQCDSGARAYVAGLVAKAGVHTGAVIVHDPAPSDQMVALCGGFDVGLALEVPYSRNRIICMNDLCTNKVFTYLMGGLALAASAMNEGSAVYEGAGFS